jgi:hypothetical protein
VLIVKNSQRKRKNENEVLGAIEKVEVCQSCNFPFFKGRIFYNYLHRRNKNKKSSFAGANPEEWSYHL